MSNFSGGPPDRKPGDAAPADASPADAGPADAGPAPAPLYLAYSGPDYIDCGAYLQGFVEQLLREHWRAEDVAVWMDTRPIGRAGYRLVALIREGPPGAGPVVTYF